MIKNKSMFNTRTHIAIPQKEYRALLNRLKPKNIILTKALRTIKQTLQDDLTAHLIFNSSGIYLKSIETNNSGLKIGEPIDSGDTEATDELSPLESHPEKIKRSVPNYVG